jgi:DNA-binding NtrC family response regulator
LALARGGTLVLDEVDALSPALQAKLHAALRHGKYKPVGSTRECPVDVRLVATSCRDLATDAAPGRFGWDLFERISSVTLRLPPLRERGSDVVRLAEHFLARSARESGRGAMAFTPEALELINRHEWPGNVAELEDDNQGGRPPLPRADHRSDPPAPDRGVAPSVEEPPTSRAAPPEPALVAGIRPLKAALEEPEKQLILLALQSWDWSRRDAARVLDINRTTLYKKMRKYGLLSCERACSR